MSKTCPGCGYVKPLEEFGKNKLRPDGLQCWCKICCNHCGRVWRTENPDESRRQSRRYHKDNKEDINQHRRETHAVKMATDPAYREKKRKQGQQQRKNNPEQRAETLFRSRCKIYGITPDEFLTLLVLQNNKCAVCGDGISKSQDIDHCHKTGKIRGILCHPCNVLLGFSKDSSLRCFLAASYLQKFGS